MRSEQQQTPSLIISSFDMIRRLQHADLVISTIPGEEWTLSCALHKQFLVDVYTLTGQVAGSQRTLTYRSGRLCEILLKMLRYGRKVHYLSHNKAKDSNITTYTRARTLHAETFEEDAKIRLRDGDIIFCLIPDQRWRLTNTCFGRTTPSIDLFRFADEQTVGTPEPHMYTHTKLEYVLLQFLCQNATFVEHQAQPNVLAFKPRW